MLWLLIPYALGWTLVFNSALSTYGFGRSSAIATIWPAAVVACVRDRL